MLETEEVDDDFFTPVASTSLANIFSSKAQKQDSDNKSLKYTPPKPNVAPKSDEEPSKGSQCLFACALIGYEWFNNTYTSRGKLGFAIMKIIKTGSHNIVLYDANKTTLSCTIVTPRLDITVNENTFISYYDDAKKYWSICATEDEIKKIKELLKTLNVLVKYSSSSDKAPPENINKEINTISTLEQNYKGDKDTDTDSSVKKKNKKSILNRMASMGHSVLPSRTLHTEKTSDSSDTNDSSNHPILIRYPPNKNLVKRSIPEKHTYEQHISSDSEKHLAPKIDPNYMNHKLVPVTHTSIISSSNNSDMNMYMSEQRICNSELRINMNRMTDRIDQIANKVNDLQNTNKDVGVGSFQIMQKLLSEYEHKIKFYEELMKSKGVIDIKPVSTSTEENESIDIGALQMKVQNLEQINKDKSSDIVKLQEEVKLLKHNIDINNEINNEESAKYSGKLAKLEKDLLSKTDEVIIVSKELKSAQSNLDSKLKFIMNETFHAISNHFENDKSYSGENVKTVIATIIKKVTVNCLTEL